MLVILRYAEELRDPARYFDMIATDAKSDAGALAAELVERQAGKFEPEKMPNEYARAVRELVKAKVEQRKPEIAIEPENGQPPKVVNIMAALKESVQAKGRSKISDAFTKRMGKKPLVLKASPSQTRLRSRATRSVN